MRALSLWQPYASLVGCRAKMIETRGYLTHCRGLVAIHAAQKIVPVQSSVAEIMVRALDPHAKPLQPQDYLDGLPRGVIVAVVEIYDCQPVERVKLQFKEWVDAEKHWGDFSPGRFCWFLKNIVTLKEPVPCKGKQGFFNIASDVEAKVRSQCITQIMQNETFRKTSI